MSFDGLSSSGLEGRSSVRVVLEAVGTPLEVAAHEGDCITVGREVRHGEDFAFESAAGGGPGAAVEHGESTGHSFGTGSWGSSSDSSAVNGSTGLCIALSGGPTSGVVDVADVWNGDGGDHTDNGDDDEHLNEAESSLTDFTDILLNVFHCLVCVVCWVVVTSGRKA